MIDPCTLPETGWGWLALVTVFLTLLGLGVAFVALPRRSWMALVGAAAMAVVGIGGATSVDAQTEECYSIKVINMGTGAWTGSSTELVDNWERVAVCEWRMVPAGAPVEATDNCVSFDLGAAVGAVKWLEISGPAVMVGATAGGLSGGVTQPTTGIGIWSVEPTLENVYDMTDAEVSAHDCANDTSIGTYVIENGDTVWVATNSNC